MKKIIHIVILWLVAITISTISFYFHWDKWPNAGYMIAGHTFYSLLAMPFSFIHTISFFDGAVLRIFGFFFIFMLVTYWGIVIYLHRKYLKTGQLKFFGFLAFILIVSSIRWLYYSVGMMGI